MGNVKAGFLGVEDSRITGPHIPVACLTKFIKQHPERTLALSFVLEGKILNS
jgi:hypothetical protein